MEIARNIIEAITACCLSCREEAPRPGEPTERTHLIGEQRRSVLANSPQIRRITTEDDVNEYANSYPNKTDEQSALSRIVQETNSNIIDVSALETHVLESSEFNNRIKTYNNRLSQQFQSIQINEMRYNGLIDDLPHPEELLAAHHSADDVAQTRSFVRACEQAVNDIKIDNPEDLVVPFQIT